MKVTIFSWIRVFLASRKDELHVDCTIMWYR